MKLHLPVLLRRSVLSCIAAMAVCTMGSSVAWADNLIFDGSTLIWNTSEDNKSFADENDAPAAFAAGDNVSFTGESTVTLGEDISAGTVVIEKGADVTLTPGEYSLDAERIELGGTLEMGDSLSVGKDSTLAITDAGAVLDSNLVQGEKGVLSVTGAGGSLGGHSLTLQQGASLILTGAVISRETTDADQDGELSLIVTPTGDGKTYTLLTGVDVLVDKTGNALAAGSYAIDDLFDSSLPGSGFWTGGTLVYAADGTLTLVRHNETVKDALEVTTRQTGNVDYGYYAGISFKNLTTYGASYARGGAIYGASGSTITLSNNGSVEFIGNTASAYNYYDSYARGGAIYGDGDITLSNNGSVVFEGNTSSSYYYFCSYAAGGAIYGYGNSTITLSNNGSVTFSGNTASSYDSYDSHARGGAIDGDTITLSNNGSVVFEGNTSSSSSTVSILDSYAHGGAICGDTITLSNNGSVEFSGNTASCDDVAYGGAIYGGSGSTITLSNNGSVVFEGNTSTTTYYYYADYSAYGGAIYGGSGSTITLSNNGSVVFEGNTSSTTSLSEFYAYGGAIYGYYITLSNNGSVEFSGNTASSYGNCAYGGAIYGGSGSTITLSGNGSVEFSGNTARCIFSACGGAIYGDGDITLSNNGSVEFSGNTSSSSESYTYGGAIYGGSGSTITLSNNGSVEFSGNTSSSYGNCAYGSAIYGGSGSTITLSGNGSVEFSGNTASSRSSSYGGAIYGEEDSTVTLSDNGSVEFRGNTADLGGAIYGEENSTIKLSNNGSVCFSGNTASYHGGAIDAYGDLRIRNNDSVLFEKNVEKSGSSYRLRSIYAGGSGGVISLSAAAGKSIEFRDSLYIASGSEVNLNEDYTYQNAASESVTIKQQGDIIFTGLTTVNDLYKVKGNVEGKEEEILNSRTTEVYAMTNLYGGRLRVEEGAIYKGYGISAHEGSASTVRVQNAALNHEGYDLIFNSGTTLELAGTSLVSGDLSMLSGSTLRLSGTENLHVGALSVQGDVEIVLASPLELEVKQGVQQFVVLSTDCKDLEWNPSSVVLLNASWDDAPAGYAAAITWLECGEDTLSLNLVTSHTVSWNNANGDGLWNNESLNWEYEGHAFGDIQGITNVVLGGQGQGNVSLVGDISVGNLLVEAGCVYDLTYLDGASLVLSGDLKLNDAASLTLHGDVSAASVNGNGLLLVEGALEIAGSVETGMLTLTQEDAVNTVADSVNVSGDITVAGSLSTGSLKGAGVSVNGALSATDVTAMTLTAGSLYADFVEADTLTLTQADAKNTVTGAVNVTGDIMVAGSLSVGGALKRAAVEVNGALSATDVTVDTLSAGMLTAGSVTADSLNLTQAGAVNAVTGAVNVTGDIMAAGSLSAGGALKGAAVEVNGALSATDVTVDTLSAGMLTAGSVSADSLNLTQAGAVNTVTGAVNVTGDITVAGSLSAGTLNGAAVMVNDALSADTITAAMLSAGSVEAGALNLTQADAVNMVTGAVNVRGNISVAGSLDCGDLSGEVVTVAGNLSAGAVQTMSLQTAHVTAASLQTDSLQTASLTLTDAAAGNTIGSPVVLSGDALVAGSLTVAGCFSANNVRVDGDFSAVSLNVASLVSAGAVELTGCNVVHHITGDMEAASVSLATGATLDVGGVLTAAEVQMSGTAQTGVSAAAFGADTMNFVLDRAALESLNIVQGERATIACSDHAFSAGFKAMLNGSATESVDAAAYTYAIATSGNMVQVEADYRWWDTQVWYRGVWVGESSWDDYLVAGYDAIDGVETIDLGGDSFSGFTMMVELEDGVDSVTFSNGSLDFEYIDMFAGQLNVGDNTTLNVTELYAEEGLTLGISGEKTSVTVSDYLEVGEVSLDYAKLYVAEAEIATLSGTTGCLTIADDGAVTIGSDVTLSSLTNGGSLDVSGHKLVVNGLTEKGGNVTAGEVETRSNMRKAATFDCLIADKVTVTNSNGNSRYTDDLSVGDGSAIGELVAETLELRDGSMQLGRDDKATSQSLQKLKLAAGTSMELNENTALAVTGTLDAGANTTVSMKQGASLSYGDVSISNKRSDAAASVTARELAAGTGAVVTNAHAAFAAAAEKSVDYQFANSSVENAGSKLLTLTNSASTLSGLHATGGNVDVLALGDITLAELEIAAARTISAAAVTVTELVKLSDGAKLAGNLTLASDATVDLGGTLTLEGALNLQTGLTLSGMVLETIAGLEEGQSHILFSGVTELKVQETMTLSNMRSIAARTQEAVSYRELMDGQQVSAADYFSNLSGDTGLVISYNKENGTVSISHTLAVPEPTTATLSLLALAALAARRRRK